MKVGIESGRLEFKETIAELNESVVSIAAMLNGHGSGELYFGVRNDGIPLGMAISDKTMGDVSQALSENLEPQVCLEISAVYFDEKHCIHVEFHGDEAPYFAFGEAYIRVADTDKRMSARELERYFLQKNERKNPWDAGVSQRSPDEVNEDALKDFLRRANEAKRIDFLYSTKVEVLGKLHLLKSGHATNAASVMFCESPGLEVQMAIFATQEKLTFLDIDRQSGRIGELIEASERYSDITLQNSTSLA